MGGEIIWSSLNELIIDSAGSSWIAVLMCGIHPRGLTWNLRIHPWKRKIIFQTIIFRFYVNLRGCTLFCVLNVFYPFVLSFPLK